VFPNQGRAGEKTGFYEDNHHHHHHQYQTQKQGSLDDDNAEERDTKANNNQDFIKAEHVIRFPFNKNTNMLTCIYGLFNKTRNANQSNKNQYNL